jgi:ribosomal protein L11 methyltransferase
MSPKAGRVAPRTPTSRRVGPGARGAARPPNQAGFRGPGARAAAKARPLWRVSVTTRPEAEDAVAELLEQIVGRPPSIYIDSTLRRSVCTIYFETRTDFSPARHLALRSGMRRIRECGLNIGAGRIATASVRREDWAESWKAHFKPIDIRGVLLIKSSWHRRRPKPHQAVVLLDPGLSFGTGQHPTTRFCLEQIVAFRKAGQGRRFLDIGTGSGLLAIAAAKLGYCAVRALDIDVEAIRVARENARRNEVLDQLALVRRDLSRLPLEARERYDLICANLIFDLLLAEKRRILNRLRRAGRLVLAGILRGQFRALCQAYEREGWMLVERRREGEWESGAFEFRERKTA